MEDGFKAMTGNDEKDGGPVIEIANIGKNLERSPIRWKHLTNFLSYVSHSAKRQYKTVPSSKF